MVLLFLIFILKLMESEMLRQFKTVSRLFIPGMLTEKPVIISYWRKLFYSVEILPD